MLVARLFGMPADIDKVEWLLDDSDDEPKVIVDPSLEAFCLMRTRVPPASPPPRPTAAALELVLAFLSGERSVRY